VIRDHSEWFIPQIVDYNSSSFAVFSSVEMGTSVPSRIISMVAEESSLIHTERSLTRELLKVSTAKGGSRLMVYHRSEAVRVLLQTCRVG
jgi:hypothetical protein